MERARHLRVHHFRFRRPIRRGKSARVLWLCRAALMGPSFFVELGDITWLAEATKIYESLDETSSDRVGCSPNRIIWGRWTVLGTCCALFWGRIRFQQAQNRLYPLTTSEAQRLKEYDETLPIEDLILFRIAERKLKWMERISTWSLGKEEDTEEKEARKHRVGSPVGSPRLRLRRSPHLILTDVTCVWCMRSLSNLLSSDDHDDETSLIRFTSTGSVTLVSSAESTSRSSSPSILSARFYAFNVDVTTSNNSGLSSIVTTLHEVEIHDRMWDPDPCSENLVTSWVLRHVRYFFPEIRHHNYTVQGISSYQRCGCGISSWLCSKIETISSCSGIHKTRSQFLHNDSASSLEQKDDWVVSCGRKCSSTKVERVEVSNGKSAALSVRLVHPLGVDIFIQSPLLFLKMCDVTTVVLVVDLGAMELRGTPPSVSSSKDVVTDVVPLRAIGTTIPTNRAMEILDQQMYESRTLRVSSVQIMLGTSSEVLRSSRRKRGMLIKSLSLRPCMYTLTPTTHWNIQERSTYFDPSMRVWHFEHCETQERVAICAK